MKIDHKSDMCNWMWYKSDHMFVEMKESVLTLKRVLLMYAIAHNFLDAAR